jgi:hypothetical protein
MLIFCFQFKYLTFTLHVFRFESRFCKQGVLCGQWSFPLRINLHMLCFAYFALSFSIKVIYYLEIMKFHTLFCSLICLYFYFQIEHSMQNPTKRRLNKKHEDNRKVITGWEEKVKQAIKKRGIQKDGQNYSGFEKIVVRLTNTISSKIIE